MELIQLNRAIRKRMKPSVAVLWYGSQLTQEHLRLSRVLGKHTKIANITRILSMKTVSSRGTVRSYSTEMPELSSYSTYTLKEIQSLLPELDTDIIVLLPTKIAHIQHNTLKSLITPILKEQKIGMVIGRCEPVDAKTILGKVIANRIHAFRVLEKTIPITHVPFCLFDGVYAVSKKQFMHAVKSREIIPGITFFYRLMEMKLKIKFAPNTFGYVTTDYSFTEFYKEIQLLKRLGHITQSSLSLQRLFLETIVNPFSLIVYGLTGLLGVLEKGVTIASLFASRRSAEESKESLSFQV